MRVKNRTFSKDLFYEKKKKKKFAKHYIDVIQSYSSFGVEIPQ